MNDDLISREAALAAIPSGWNGEPHQSNMDYGPNIAAKAIAAIRALPAPTTARLMAEAMKLPEVAALIVAAAWVKKTRFQSSGEPFEALNALYDAYDAIPLPAEPAMADAEAGIGDEWITLSVDDDCFKRADNALKIAGMNVATTNGRSLSIGVARILFAYAELDAVLDTAPMTIADAARMMLDAGLLDEISVEVALRVIAGETP